MFLELEGTACWISWFEASSFSFCLYLENFEKQKREEPLLLIMQSREEWWVAAMEQVDNDKEFLMDISEDLKEEVASHLAKIETALQGTVSFDWYSHQ